MLRTIFEEVGGGGKHESEVMSKTLGRGARFHVEARVVVCQPPNVSVPFRMAAYGKSGVRLMGFV